ncbi:MAG: CBS domain-containing protein [Candidatus Thiodiazotropha sp.]
MPHNILYDLWRDMRVTVDDVSEQIMHQPIDSMVEYVDFAKCTVKESASVYDALCQFYQCPTCLLLISGRGNNPRGFVTRTDLMKAVANGKSDAKVTEIMTKYGDRVFIHPDAIVESALLEFKNHKIRKLLVFDKDGTKLGVLKQQVLMDWVRDVLLGESQIGAA